ncbi:hypothetical protein SADUNF_Sadunf19G0108100 [Salix dunnii]|uniref:Wound-responsive family protein n=1 Tax=Salix dunnii TaxID=1413687 RepID=A0A835J2A8_9ROSI|nr:hypothetical protein SADUNF_Sadunf19G0108100 [Salix dunnii]
MSSASKAWLVAAAIGGVEALKDQGFCRWNYTLRSLHQHAKNHVRSVSQARKLSSSSSAMFSNIFNEEKAKQSEESLRKVMSKNVCKQLQIVNFGAHLLKSNISYALSVLFGSGAFPW